MKTRFFIVGALLLGAITWANETVNDGDAHKISTVDTDSILSYTDAISVTERINDQIQTTLFSSKNASLLCCPTCVFFGNDSRRFYDSIMTANRLTYEPCANQSPLGKKVKVKFTQVEDCSKSSVLISIQRANPVNYTVSREQDGVHLQMDLRFNFASHFFSGPSDWRAGVMLKSAKACIPKIAEVWKRYGITFDLKMDSNREKSFEEPNIEMDLRDEIGRSNTVVSYYYEQNQYKLDSERQDSFCKTMLHELGHDLGLHDEYPDPDCPDRLQVSSQPNDSEHFGVMAEVWKPWSEIDFFPRHMKQVIGPLCSRLFYSSR